MLKQDKSRKVENKRSFWNIVENVQTKLDCEETDMSKLKKAPDYLTEQAGRAESSASGPCGSTPERECSEFEMITS